MPHEAKFIQGLLLSVQVIPNKEVWLPSLHGEYTAQSAYKLMANLKSITQSSCSSKGVNRKLWKGLWSLQVQYKVKHFLWRAAIESLPTLHNLMRRNVVPSALCSVCKSSCEGTIHVLWNCQRLLVIWEANEEFKKVSKLKLHCFADLLEVVLNRKE